SPLEISKSAQPRAAVLPQMSSGCTLATLCHTSRQCGRNSANIKKPAFYGTVQREKTGAFSPPRFWAPAFKSTPIPRDDRAAHLLSANFLMESKGQPLLFQSMQRRCRVEERRVNSKGFVRIFPLNNQEDAATPACELMYTERDLRNGAFLFIFIAPYKAVWGS